VPTNRLGGGAVVMARTKKHSAKSDLHVRARALTPSDPIRLKKIVEEIVTNLRPWKAARMSEATVTAAVNNWLKTLLSHAPLEAERRNRSQKTQNRIHAQQLDGALHKVETLLASAPDPLRLFLLNPLPNMTEQGGLMPYKTPSVNNIERANQERADSFAAELKRLRQVCARGASSAFGYHANYDTTKFLCASYAHGLMRAYSGRTITGTKDAEFRTITSLAYEAVSGQQGVDLKRACDWFLAKIRITSELGTD
jgi:hypothetical protein